MIVTALVVLWAAADIPDSQLVTRVGDKEVFAPAFRGVWSKSAATCKAELSQETFEVAENRLYGYEWDSVLLKSTPMIGQSGPRSGQWANTVVVLTAHRAETDVGTGKMRLSLMDDKLYMTNAEAVSEEQHLTAEYANVRCPRAGRK